jgi:hypothetical protein
MKLVRDGIFMVLAGVLVAVYALSTTGFPLDDSWIHQVYGRNFAQLGQWAFVPDVPSGASTAPAYTLLLALGYFFNIPYMLWTHALGAVALAVAGMIGARIADMLYPKLTYVGWAVGLALIGSWHLIWAAASGMETMLFCTLLIMALWLVWREVDGNLQMTTRPIMLRGAFFGAVLAIATATRPEGVVFGAILGVALLIARPMAQFRQTFLWGIGAAAMFALVISPYLLNNLYLNGSMLPNTSDAKYARIVPLLRFPFTQRFFNMLEPILAGAQFFLVFGLVYFLVRIRTQGRKIALYLAPLVWFVVLALLYTVRLPVPFQHGRYMIPALPMIVLLGTIGIVAMVIDWKESILGRVLSRTLALATVLTMVAFAVLIGRNAYITDTAIINEEMVDLAFWIEAELPKDQLLAIHDIGAVGYFASRPLLDVAGLITPEIIPFINQPEAMWAYMQAQGSVYFMAFPSQIPNEDPNDPRLCLIYQSDGRTTPSVGEAKMSIYRLNWTRASC